MLSLNECRKAVGNGEINYTDEEIIIIRDWLYHIADIAIEAYEIENQHDLSGTTEGKNIDKP